MPTPTVSRNSKCNSVGCGNRSWHSSYWYAPSLAAETYNFSEDVVHHADSENAVAKLVADCFCFGKISCKKPTCSSRLFNKSFAAKLIGERISSPCESIVKHEHAA